MILTNGSCNDCDERSRYARENALTYHILNQVRVDEQFRSDMPDLGFVVKDECKRPKIFKLYSEQQEGQMGEYRGGG